MSSRAVRHAGRCIGLVAMAGAPVVAHAQDIRFSGVASVGASAESNPYNESNVSGAAIAATAEVRPTITVSDEQTTVTIGASAQFRQFLRRYGLEDNYAVNSGIVRRQTDRLTLRGNSFFSYNRNGYGSFGRPALTTPDPIAVTPDPTVPGPALNPLIALGDVNLFGTRTRTTSYGSGLGADMVLGAYANLSLDLDARALRYDRVGLNEFNTLHGEMHLSHQLNESISVGITGGYGKTNYLDLGQGDAGTTDLLASVDGKIGARWTVSVSLGGSWTTIDGRAGRPDVHYTSISGRMRFCWQGEFSRFCLGGQRSPQPAADGNVRVSTTITGDYSLRVSERGSVSLSGSYAKTGASRDLSVGAQPPVDFVTASARYDHRLDNKMTAFVSANLSKTYERSDRRQANVGAVIGLQYSFGATQ